MTPFHSIKFLFDDIDDYQSFLKGQEASYVVLAALYGVITLSVGVVALADASPLFIAAPLYLLAFVVIGWAQYSIGNGMHEAVHKNFGNKNGDPIGFDPHRISDRPDDAISRHAYPASSLRRRPKRSRLYFLS